MLGISLLHLAHEYHCSIKWHEMKTKIKNENKTRENIPLEIFIFSYKEIETFRKQCQVDSITLPIRSSTWSLSSKLLIGSSCHPKDD